MEATVQYCAEFARDGHAVEPVLRLLRLMARSHPDVVRRHVLALAALAAGGFYSQAQRSDKTQTDGSRRQHRMKHLVRSLHDPFWTMLL